MVVNFWTRWLHWSVTWSVASGPRTNGLAFFPGYPLLIEAGS